nr:cbb3-type cytochrome c oxidase subunit I [Halomicroarcula nitratireducens]
MALSLALGAYYRRQGDERNRSETAMVADGGQVEETIREHPTGFTRWLTTVNHRDIGKLYGVYSAVTFAWAGVAVVLMRTELITPDATMISMDLYNALLTTHGLTMLLLFGTPMSFAFANYFIPLLVGADEMAFPRVNAIAFWLLPPATILVWGGFFLLPFDVAVGPAKTGWTMYTPLSRQLVNPGVSLTLLGLHLSGISSTMGAINIITTIVTERSEGVSWANLDILSWTLLTMSGLILFAFPLLGSAIIMLLLDRVVGTTFYAVEGGGTLLWQHLFWFFGHPEVYILILPAMGLTSFILPRFAGRPIFGFQGLVYSTLAIGVLSFGVWAHHMFTTGIDPRLRMGFMAVSLAIAVPSAVKTFNWIGTLYNANIRLTTPMLFCLGFVSNFIVGGITGVFLASIPFDYLAQGTYWVVGHFHYLFMGGLVFTFFAGFYYWFPLLTGRWYNRRLAQAHFWLSLVGVNITFFAMQLLGFQGMPRRYVTYFPKFALLHQVTTAGTYIIGAAIVIWLANMLYSWQYGDRIESGDPWELEADGLLTREWSWFRDRWEERGTNGGSD